MKKILFLFLAFWLISAAIISGCKKDERRITEIWKVDQVTKADGTNSSNDYNGNVELKKDGSFIMSGFASLVNGVGTWQFADNNNNLVLTYDWGSETYIIIKLEKKAFWFKETGSGPWEYHLSPK